MLRSAGPRAHVTPRSPPKKKFRDLIQGPRLALLRFLNNCAGFCCGGAGYCPPVREVSAPAATCVFGDLSLAFGVARRPGGPNASPP